MDSYLQSAEQEMQIGDAVEDLLWDKRTLVRLLCVSGALLLTAAAAENTSNESFQKGSFRQERLRHLLVVVLFIQERYIEWSFKAASTCWSDGVCEPRPAPEAFGQSNKHLIILIIHPLTV